MIIIINRDTVLAPLVHGIYICDCCLMKEVRNNFYPLDIVWRFLMSESFRNTWSRRNCTLKVTVLQRTSHAINSSERPTPKSCWQWFQFWNRDPLSFSVWQTSQSYYFCIYRDAFSVLYYILPVTRAQNNQHSFSHRRFVKCVLYSGP